MVTYCPMLLLSELRFLLLECISLCLSVWLMRPSHYSLSHCQSCEKLLSPHSSSLLPPPYPGGWQNKNVNIRVRRPRLVIWLVIRRHNEITCFKLKGRKSEKYKCWNLEFAGRANKNPSLGLQSIAYLIKLPLPSFEWNFIYECFWSKF